MTLTENATGERLQVTQEIMKALGRNNRNEGRN